MINAEYHAYIDWRSVGAAVFGSLRLPKITVVCVLWQLHVTLQSSRRSAAPVYLLDPLSVASEQ